MICVFSVIGDHEKKVTLDHDIQTRIGKLKGDYADIVVKALRWLNTRYPEDRDAVRWLNEILRGLQREPLVLPRKSISDKIPLDDQLQERWSFTNPAVLRRLVRETHDSNLNEQMDKYIEDFKDVRSSIPISDQELKKELIFEPFEPDKPCLILVLERITYFGDIDVFLKEVFDIYTRFFRIHKIEPGCIKVTLQFDTSMESHIQARIDDKYEAVKHYAKMHIISNKKQTEPSEDATSIDEENNGSCIEEVTKEHRTQLLLCAESRHDKSRERLWKTYAGKQSPVYTRTKFRKRAYSTNASSKEELCKRIEKPINSKYMQSTVVCNNPTHAS